MREIFDRYGCDKGHRHGYEQVYEPAFLPMKDEPLRILEVGVFEGASVLAWADYFPNAEIVGVDTFQRVPMRDVPKHERVTLVEADSTEVKLDGRFDIVIDDGAHDFVTQRKTFENLHRLADRYFIEDVWPFNHMTNEQRQHPWLVKMKDRGFSPVDYYRLLDALKGHQTTFHDLRKGHQPDSCILEVSAQ